MKRRNDFFEKQIAKLSREIARYDRNEYELTDAISAVKLAGEDMREAVLFDPETGDTTKLRVSQQHIYGVHASLKRLEELRDYYRDMKVKALEKYDAYVSFVEACKESEIKVADRLRK